MTRRLKELQVTVSAEYEGKEVAPEEKVFEILVNPEKAKEVLNEDSYVVYKDFFEEVLHEEEDFVSKRYEVIEFVADVGEEENEIVFGFIENGDIQDEKVIELVSKVFEPIVEILFGDEMKITKTEKYYLYEISESYKL